MLLSLIVWLPAIFGVIAYLSGERRSKHVTLLGAVLDLVLALYLSVSFNWSEAYRMQFTEVYPWIRMFGVSYKLSVDGLSMTLVLLTTILFVSSALGSMRIIKERNALYNLLLMVLQTGILGVFVSMDLFIFFLFWEVELIPMYFLIAIWGSENRRYAAIKFFIFTHIGSLLMFFTFIFIHLKYFWTTGIRTFDYSTLTAAEGYMPLTLAKILCSLLIIGYLIKVPSVPLHTWLPDAHVEAPSPISVILAGLLLKTGGYGILRMGYGLFPKAAASISTWIAGLGALSLFYASLVAISQINLKRLVAYSSIAHMGVFLVGIGSHTVIGWVGAMFMMFSHGLINGMLFNMCGFYKYRFHSYDIPILKGFTKAMPISSAFLVFGGMASLGLPGLSGFPAEFFSFMGAFKAFGYVAIPLIAGLLLNAAYNLWMIQRMIFGEQRYEDEAEDLVMMEIVALLIPSAFIILLGVYPAPLAELYRVVALNMIG